MKKELDEALCRDFPKLFKDRRGDMTKTAMCWGFPGDGWEPLLRRCAAKLEAINDKIEDPERHIVASQVKEKFGTLRFYTGSYPSEYATEYSEAIDTAEAESEATCEQCGKPGKTEGGGWLKTVCDDHKRRDDK